MNFQLLSQVFNPPRNNFSNYLYNSSSSHHHFQQENYTFTTFDGISLNFILLKQQSSKSTIIYTHSYGSCKYEGSNLLDLCYQQKLNLCIYDSRACGKSSGGQINFGFKEKFDLLKLISILKSEHKLEYFILWGRSIGCNAVLQSINFLQSLIINKNLVQNEIKNIDIKKISLENFLGIVLDCPYSSFDDLFQDNFKRKFPIASSLFSSPLKSLVKLWINQKLDIDIGKDKNQILFEQCGIPLVFFYSNNDFLIPKFRNEQLIKTLSNSFDVSYYKIIELNQGHSCSREIEDIQQATTFLLNLFRMQKPSLFLTSLKKIENQMIKYQKETEQMEQNQIIQRDMSDIDSIMYESIFSKGTFQYQENQNQKKTKFENFEENQNKNNSKNKFYTIQEQKKFEKKSL